MVNYQLGKIYKIVCNETGEQYIGSTTQKMLCTRLAHHVSTKKCSSKGIIERGNYSMVLIENYPCSSKDELHKRERHFIETLDNCVNMVIPTRTRKEHYVDNKKKLLEYKRDYIHQNKEIIQKYRKLYYDENKSDILKQRKDYYDENKVEISVKHKIYHQNNRADILNQRKIYRQQNRDIINKKQQEKRQEKRQEQRQAKKLTPEEHRAERREYWQSKKEIQKDSLSPTE